MSYTDAYGNYSTMPAQQTLDQIKKKREDGIAAIKEAIEKTSLEAVLYEIIERIKTGH